jgi:hypothetical protein
MTPDNAGYYHAAYVATAVILIFYAVSIAVRRRRARDRHRSA